MYGPKVRSFQSMEAYVMYCYDHPEAARSLSPGGAAAALGCQRPYVYALVRKGYLRAWTVYDKDYGPAGWQGEGPDRVHEQASYVMISADDVAAYPTMPKAPPGRPRKRERVAA